MSQVRAKVRSKLRIKNSLTRNFLSEFIGTFLLVVIGNASVAVFVLSNGASGNAMTMALAWGLALMTALSVSGEASGAHLNPAVTLAFAAIGRCKWKQVPVYFVAQYFGAFVASAVLFGVYHDAFAEFSEKNLISGSIFATFPQKFLGMPNAFADQVFGTAVLLVGICSITDRSNMKIYQSQYPLYIGLLLTGILLTFGYNCGAALNPARDMGPRLFLVLAGWSASDVFMPDGKNFWWIPILGTHIGAFVGVFIYSVFIGLHLERDELESGVMPLKEMEISTISSQRHQPQ